MMGRWGRGRDVLLIGLLTVIAGLQMVQLWRHDRASVMPPAPVWPRPEAALETAAWQAYAGELARLRGETLAWSQDAGLPPAAREAARRLTLQCMTLTAQYRVVLENLRNVDTNGYQAGCCDAKRREGEPPQRMSAKGMATQTELWSDVLLENPRDFLACRRADGVVCYTRDGSLRLNDEGALQTAQGLTLAPAVTGIPTGAQNLAVTLRGEVLYREEKSGKETVAGRVALFRFPPEVTLARQGAGFYVAPPGAPPQQGWPGEGGFGELRGGWIEGSNVDRLVEGEQVCRLNQELAVLREEIARLRRTTQAGRD